MSISTDNPVHELVVSGLRLIQCEGEGKRQELQRESDLNLCTHSENAMKLLKIFIMEGHIK